MVSTPTRTTAARSRRRRRPAVARPPDRRPAAAPAPPTAGRPAVTPAARVRAWYRGFWSALEGTGKSRNGSTYYLILGSTLALTAIGIMMVLSASSVEAIAAGESPYSAALKQGMFAAIGVFCMFVLSRVNVVWLKRFAWPAHRSWPLRCWGWSSSWDAARWATRTGSTSARSPSSPPKPPSLPWRSGWPRCLTARPSSSTSGGTR